MKMANKTYKFRLYPVKEQEVLLNKHFGHSRWVYNHFLNERKEKYQADKKSDNYYKQDAALTKLKKQEETKWLKDWYGKEFVKVNRFYPSSKTCGDCVWINQELKLSDREWTCESCGVIHNRDINASRNIIEEGLRIYRQGLSITKVEDKLDYLGSTSVETRSPSNRVSVGG